jgi:chromosome segregation ATPase
MSISNIVREWLGINQNEENLRHIEENLRRMEERQGSTEENVRHLDERLSSVEDQLEHYGNYANRSLDVLEFMLTNVKGWIHRLERLEVRAEQHDVDKAKRLLQRLRNNRTRIENNLRKTG